MTTTSTVTPTTGVVVDYIMTSFRKGTPAFRKSATSLGYTIGSSNAPNKGTKALKPGQYLLFCNKAQTQVCVMSFDGQVTRGVDLGRAVTGAEIRSFLSSHNLSLDQTTTKSRTPSPDVRMQTMAALEAAAAARFAARSAASKRGWINRKAKTATTKETAVA